MATDNQPKAKVCENCKFFEAYHTTEGTVHHHFCLQSNLQVFGHFKCSNNKFTEK